MVSFKKLAIFGSLSTLLVVLNLAPSFISSPKPVYADEQKNALLLVAEHCHDLNNLDYRFDVGVENQNSCEGWQKLLKDNLGCSDKMFYQKFIGTDPEDASVGDKKWYTKQGEYKDCYNRALAQHGVLSSNDCKKFKDGSPNEDKCKEKQNQLNDALGCDSSMFRSIENDYWVIKPGALANCKTQIDRVGNARLIVIGPDGKPVQSDKPTNDPAVAASGGGGSGSGGSSETEASCEVSVNPLSWILCPLIDIGAKFTDFAFKDLVKPLMQGSPIQAEGGNPSYEAWQRFRTIGNILLIGIMLILVLSQLTEGWGFNAVDAYTAKKVAPRILVGVIGINLSIYLCLVAIDVTTVVGTGINQLLKDPFISAGTFNDPKLPINTESVVGVAAGGIGAGILGKVIAVQGFANTAVTTLGLLGPLMISLVLVSIAVLATLVIRYGLIIFLTVVSPIAIACFILPGTEKYFKSWWNLFTKTLFVYPIIAVIFAMSDIMAAIFLANSESLNDTAGLAAILVGVVAVYLPLFLIPFAFKFAGGAIGAVAKLANDRAQGLSGRARDAIGKARQDPNNFLGKARNQARDRRINRGMTGNQFFGGVAAGLKKDGSGFRGGYRLNAGVVKEGHDLRRQAELGKDGYDAQILHGNDDAYYAVLKGMKTKGSATEKRTAMVDFLRNEKGYSQDQAERTAMAGSRLMSNASADVVESLAINEIAGSGTGFGKGPGEMHQAIIEATNGGQDSLKAFNLIASGRANAERAKRYDISGASFGTHAGVFNNLVKAYNDPNATEASKQAALNSANTELIAGAIEGQPAYTLANGKSEATENIAKVMSAEVQNAFADYQAGKSFTDGKTGLKLTAEEYFKQRTAGVAGLYDAMGGASSKNGKIFGTRVLGVQVPGGEGGGAISFNEFIEKQRDDPVFRQYRREYGRSNMSDAEKQAMIRQGLDPNAVKPPTPPPEEQK